MLKSADGRGAVGGKEEVKQTKGCRSQQPFQNSSIQSYGHFGVPEHAAFIIDSWAAVVRDWFLSRMAVRGRQFRLESGIGKPVGFVTGRQTWISRFPS